MDNWSESAISNHMFMSVLGHISDVMAQQTELMPLETWGLWDTWRQGDSYVVIGLVLQIPQIPQYLEYAPEYGHSETFHVCIKKLKDATKWSKEIKKE